MSKMLDFDPTQMTERKWEQLREIFERAASEGEIVSVVTSVDELSPNEAAQRLVMSRASAMKLVHSGELQARKVGAHYRIPAKEADRYHHQVMDAMTHGIAVEIKDELGLD